MERLREARGTVGTLLRTAQAAFAAMVTIGTGPHTRADGFGRAPLAWTPAGGAPYRLTAAGDIGRRRLWCTTGYRSESERDAAAERLRGLTVEVLGERLALHEAVVHPSEAVPAERFLRAAERASADAPAATESETREAMTLQARTIELVARLASPTERVALELAEPVSLHWLLDEGRLFQTEVAGGGWGSVEHPGVPAPEPDDPFRLYALIDAFELGEAEILTIRELPEDEWRRTDPVLDAIGWLCGRALRFNNAQLVRPLPWPLDVAGLRAALLPLARRSSRTPERSPSSPRRAGGGRRNPSCWRSSWSTTTTDWFARTTGRRRPKQKRCAFASSAEHTRPASSPRTSSARDRRGAVHDPPARPGHGWRRSLADPQALTDPQRLAYSSRPAMAVQVQSTHRRTALTASN
jgi:hypothetical protein